MLRISILKASGSLGITQSKKDNRLVSEDDLKQCKSILNLTSAHLEGYEPSAPIHVSRGTKFLT